MLTSRLAMKLYDQAGLPRTFVTVGAIHTILYLTCGWDEETISREHRNQPTVWNTISCHG